MLLPPLDSTGGPCMSCLVTCVSRARTHPHPQICRATASALPHDDEALRRAKDTSGTHTHACHACCPHQCCTNTLGVGSYTARTSKPSRAPKKEKNPALTSRPPRAHWHISHYHISHCHISHCHKSHYHTSHCHISHCHISHCHISHCHIAARSRTLSGLQRYTAADTHRRHALPGFL